MPMNRVAARWMPTPRKIVHDHLQPSRAAPLVPFFLDGLSEAIGPAIFELRKATTFSEVQVILADVPPHLHGAVAEGAASRNLVAAPIVLFVLQEIGIERLKAQLGRALAEGLIGRYAPTARDAAEAEWQGLTAA